MKSLFRNIVGVYTVVLTQMLAWLIVIGALTAVLGAVASLFGSGTGLTDNLVVSIWVSILIDGPVALAAVIQCVRRYFKSGPWPEFISQGRWIVAGVWAGMAGLTAAATDSLLFGIPWYGSIAVGIWFVAPKLFGLSAGPAR